MKKIRVIGFIFLGAAIGGPLIAAIMDNLDVRTAIYISLLAVAVALISISRD